MCQLSLILFPHGKSDSLITQIRSSQVLLEHHCSAELWLCNNFLSKNDRNCKARSDHSRSTRLIQWLCHLLFPKFTVPLVPSWLNTFPSCHTQARCWKVFGVPGCALHVKECLILVYSCRTNRAFIRNAALSPRKFGSLPWLLSPFSPLSYPRKPSVQTCWIYLALLSFGSSFLICAVLSQLPDQFPLRSSLWVKALGMQIIKIKCS